MQLVAHMLSKINDFVAFPAVPEHGHDILQFSSCLVCVRFGHPTNCICLQLFSTETGSLAIKGEKPGV